MNPKEQDLVVDGDVYEAQQSTTQQTKQHKKQVRRRLHTSRPYQEKLLNMAEARREIVTALKYHRASMKQASEQQQQQQQHQTQEEQQRQSVSLNSSHKPSFEQDGRYKSKRNPRIYPSCKPNFTNYMDGFSHSYSPYPPPQASNYYTYPYASSLAPPPLMPDNPNFILPSQTLGLNLNFHDFNTIDTTTFHLNNSSFSSSYSSPTSSSPPLSVVTDQEVPSALGVGSSSLVLDSIQACASTQVISGGLHTAMDDEGMEEIRSLGEQYQMEWNDTMNLVKSACWSKFLKNIENGAPGPKIEDGSFHVFEEHVEFPPWLDANGSCLEQCSENYFQDSNLPCMDIGDIEGIDEDWLV
ncbi:hypothetical protein Lal_00001901 [Lupinus albus]|uniref:Putative WD40/YVTN repeat-like-containing domain-containing protein n=1 Tax=Lupinus albus TaxID=3870 RepID=A0A6A5P7I2_LUPAL|nr:putative WD40/YVTN repeat-like-containing domain-containing protein [Lupinus albus]KAF1893427.1 hypothetical protein Lal_00001901 [Lupinus albus]